MKQSPRSVRKILYTHLNGQMVIEMIESKIVIRELYQKVDGFGVDFMFELESELSPEFIRWITEFRVTVMPAMYGLKIIHNGKTIDFYDL